ncbi:MAG: hypothetical protein HYZ34_01635 [Ignavibacteriae bacterium]|nr:hypothetical protein [Ignavibacteriota bacterium]
MTKDERWIQQHFEELVVRYAGRSIAVANQELFVGNHLKEAYEQAQKKYPKIIPSVLRVPHPEDFLCAL